jgi:hypothetical protein
LASSRRSMRSTRGCEAEFGVLRYSRP